jgi:GNAT superfamily N-acetyltransferase
MATTTATDRITLREVEPSDTDELARICFEAFGGIHDYHRFPRDFPALEAAAGMLGMWVPHPQVWGVVAEIDGRIVGSNFLDERDSVPGVGPITIDPESQNSGVGRKLMEAVIERGKDAPSIRLVQDGFHMRSLSLYASLGFDVTASCVVMSGKLRDQPPADVEVRPVGEDDLDACGALCRKVHGFDRNGALRDAVAGPFAPFAAVRDGQIRAYASSLVFWPMAYGVAATEEDMKALLLGAGAASDEPVALLVPLRSGLFRWCLDQGLRGVKPMNVMTRGEYQEPQGSWFPSVLY